MINNIGQGGRKRARAHIKRQLDCAGAVGVESLGQHGDRTQSHRLGITEFRDAHQNKQKVDRERPCNARKSDAQTRGKNCDPQVTDKLRNVPAALMNRCLKQGSRARSDHQADKNLGADGQAFPRLFLSGHRSGLGALFWGGRKNASSKDNGLTGLVTMIYGLSPKLR